MGIKHAVFVGTAFLLILGIVVIIMAWDDIVKPEGEYARLTPNPSLLLWEGYTVNADDPETQHTLWLETNQQYVDAYVDGEGVRLIGMAERDPVTREQTGIDLQETPCLGDDPHDAYIVSIDSLVIDYTDPDVLDMKVSVVDSGDDSTIGTRIKIFMADGAEVYDSGVNTSANHIDTTGSGYDSGQITIPEFTVAELVAGSEYRIEAFSWRSNVTIGTTGYDAARDVYGENYSRAQARYGTFIAGDLGSFRTGPEATLNVRLRENQGVILEPCGAGDDATVLLRDFEGGTLENYEFTVDDEFRAMTAIVQLDDTGDGTSAGTANGDIDGALTADNIAGTTEGYGWVGDNMEDADDANDLFDLTMRTPPSQTKFYFPDCIDGTAVDPDQRYFYTQARDRGELREFNIDGFDQGRVWPKVDDFYLDGRTYDVYASLYLLDCSLYGQRSGRFVEVHP